MRRLRRLALILMTFLSLAEPALAQEVRLKDIGRFMGWRENALVGYGLVVGLSGSGDSPGNQVTQRAVSNLLSNMGTTVSPDQVRARNVAAVMVTAELPPAVSVGDRINITVSSVADARSLAGGSLLLTPLRGPDQRLYALAQGALVVGGHRFDADLNVQQRNYASSAIVPDGATVETAVPMAMLNAYGELTYILKEPDFTNADRVASAVNAALGARARVSGAGTVLIATDGDPQEVFRLIARMEEIRIRPDAQARIVINERSGTVVAGGGVQISSVAISQGDIRVSVSVDNQASQPGFYAGSSAGVRSLIVTNTRLEVAESAEPAVVRFPNTTVADLVEGLAKVNIDTRGMIGILQAIKAAGALHAEIVVQ